MLQGRTVRSLAPEEKGDDKTEWNRLGLTVAPMPCPSALQGEKSWDSEEERGGGSVYLRYSCIYHFPTLIQLVSCWWFCSN